MRLAALGVISAAGEGSSLLFDAALARTPLARPVERYPTAGLRTRSAALVPAATWASLQARWPGRDPAVQLALGAIAQLSAARALPSSTPLLVGTSLGCTTSWEQWHRALVCSSLSSPPRPSPSSSPPRPSPEIPERGALSSHPRRSPSSSPPCPSPEIPERGAEASSPRGVRLASSPHGDIAWQLADELELTGPALTVSTACTSSTAALIMAADMIRSGEIERALVVGVDVLGLFVHAGFDALRALSPEGRPPTPFAADRAGLWLGEGAACVLLERDGSGPRYLAGATAGDAFHMTAPDRQGTGLRLATEAALREARVGAEQIAWISAHATGTSYNDAMEAHGLRAVFGDTIPPLHALKPVIGHTLGASGLIEVVLLAEVLRRGLCPPTYRPAPLDPELPPLRLDDAPTPLLPGPLLTLNSAFAGHNTAILLGPP